MWYDPQSNVVEARGLASAATTNRQEFRVAADANGPTPLILSALQLRINARSFHP
jgi:hypothetical protein